MPPPAAAAAAAVRPCSDASLAGVEWQSTLLVVCAGLTMALVSVMEVQRMAPGDAMVRLRCLAMFAMPVRDRAAKERTTCVKSQNS